jgi:hypothetical protein
METNLATGAGQSKKRYATLRWHSVFFLQRHISLENRRGGRPQAAADLNSIERDQN